MAGIVRVMIGRADDFRQEHTPALAAFSLADDSRYGPTTPSAAAFAGRGRFYSGPANTSASRQQAFWPKHLDL
jgi:hypothetical protein